MSDILIKPEKDNITEKTDEIIYDFTHKSYNWKIMLCIILLIFIITIFSVLYYKMKKN